MMVPGLRLPWREIGLGPFDHERADSTILILSRPFMARRDSVAGQMCCYVRIDDRARQVMSVEMIKFGVRMSHAMGSAAQLIRERPEHISEEVAQYNALWNAMTDTWNLFEAVYGDGDPEYEKQRRAAFAKQWGENNPWDVVPDPRYP